MIRKPAALLAVVVTAASVLVTSAGATAGSAPAAGAAAPAARPAPQAPFADGVVLVQFDKEAGASAKGAARRNAGAVASRAVSPGAPGLERLELAPGQSVAKAIEALTADPNVRFAEPDYLVTASATSDDPYFTGGSLWGMYGDASSPANQFGSQAAEAWAAGYTGSAETYVVVIDEGIQVTHPDLASNIWTNPFETAGNGIDDDGNGYVDDVNGWDFFYGDASVYDAGEDSHGTHVSGTIGGVGGNGAGVAGVNWDVTLISAKFLGPGGGATSAAIRAVDYATDLKVRHGLNIVATSNSWGGGGFSQAMQDAINRAGDQGILFVAAAGNSSANNDATNAYPANYDCTKGGTRGWDCVIVVASITSTGALSSFSSYGATKVDIGAPGSGVNSSVPPDTYASYSGTSMATPHVSGAAALCASINPTLNARQVLQSVLWSAAPTTSLSGKVATGGRLDVGTMATQCVGPSVAASGTPSGLAASNPTASSVRLTWSAGSSADHQGFEIQRSPAGCASYTTAAWVKAGTTSSVLGGLQPSTGYCFRIRAFNNFSGGTSGPWAAETTAVTADPPPPYVCTATTFAWLDPAAIGSTQISLTDDASATYALPFTFRLYDKAFTSLTVSSNGLAQLGPAAGASAFSNTVIPGASDPNAIIAPWWDDLNPAAGGSIWLSSTGTAPDRQVVVSWVGVPHYGVTDSAVSFQVVLAESDGSITLQYLDATTSTSATSRARSASVGVENDTGIYGTQISYNTASITDQSARRCTSSQAGAPSITAASLPAGLVGSAYAESIPATGGTAPLTFSLVSGALPAGLTLAGSGGVAGTPTAAGLSTFTVRVTDAFGLSSDRQLTLNVLAPLAVTTSSLPAVSVNDAYSASLAATGGTAPYAWSLASGSLPDGLSLAADGSITGMPTTPGTSSFTVRVTDNSAATATRALTLQVRDLVSVTTSSLAPAQVGLAYRAALTASGGTGTFSWSVASGALPAGLTLSSAGVISGTPTTAGTAAFTVRATDAAGKSADQPLTLQVVARLTISTASLPTATVGVTYSASLAATGGGAPYTWTVASGALPAGLTLSSAGVISGTPTTATSTSVTFRVTDALGMTVTRALTLTVNLPPLPGSFSKSFPAKSATGVSFPSVTLTWAAATNATSYEVCVSRTSGVCSTWVPVGTSRSYTVTSLVTRTTYYWQVRARNSSGVTNANSGTWWRFTTR